MRPLDDLRPRSWQARRGHGLVVARHAVEVHGGTLRRVRGPIGSGIELRLPARGRILPVREAVGLLSLQVRLRCRRPVMSRRRAAAMLGAAVVCGGLAVSGVDRYAGDMESQVGPLVPVVVAARRHSPRRLITPRRGIAH